MNKKIQKLIEPGLRLCLLIMAAFAVATFFFNEMLAAIEGGVIVVLVIYSVLAARHRNKQLVEYIESVTYNAESAKNNTLMNFPLPIVVFKLSDNRIIWGNQIFFDLFGGQQPSFEAELKDMVPGFSSKWLLEGKKQYPGLVQVGDRKYQLHGNIIRARNEDISEGARDFMGITYWVDVTEFDNIKAEYEASRPVSIIFIIDNYDELMKNVPDRTKVELRGHIDDLISQWCDGKNGFLRRYDRDRYVLIMESRYLRDITEKKFDILESIRSIVSPTGIQATLSIGVGKEGGSFDENFAFANLAVEMALSRGGDQAVIKGRFNFEFFGGKNVEVETRSKVKSRVTANALAELMRASSQVFVMGHKLSDLDSIGAAAGVVCIARKLDKPANIIVDPNKNAAGVLIETLKATPEYKNAFLSPDEAIVKADSRTLLVVVDTNRPEQVESESLLEACNRVAVIDHHRRAASYIQNAALAFHEPYASSVCELMSELLQELTESGDLTRAEAEAMLSGIVLDTKYFTIRTGERTFDAAAFFRRMGADTSEVKKYLQSDLDSNIEKYAILQSVHIYRDNIAIAVKEEGEANRVVAAQAADDLLNISGVEASFVAYATADGGVTISARSIGEVNVQLILEKLGGGGNKSSAGAQVKDITLRDAVNTLCAAIDEFLDT
ncbi:MAG: DHH family phosphoesterase [Ruminococcaceae bacterium]|nr:DHH family phosphoesterase [Oscillospiraceae bacterium]